MPNRAKSGANLVTVTARISRTMLSYGKEMTAETELKIAIAVPSV
jgi:hypothetical protein